MSENSFKLIAIRPLVNCDKRFLKNLSKGTIYKFYNEYIFRDSNSNEIINNLNKISSITYTSNVPTDLYQIESDRRKIDINISAIVGKNGSGKSSLLELLYASCYTIASRKKILKDTSYYSEKRKENNGILSKKDIDDINEIQSVYNDLNVELFYSIDENIFCVEINQFEINHFLINGEDDRFPNGYYEYNQKFEDNLQYVINEVFFYTISINYSIYGLNSKFTGNWVKELFHKNDGYQTPLVINPFREEGNINVNSELHLAQTRLLTNIITNNSNNTINNKQIDNVIFELDIRKHQQKVDDDLDDIYINFKKAYGFSDSNFITNVYNKLYGGIKYGNVELLLTDIPNSEYQCKYIFRKILKISQIYSEYRESVKIDFKSKKVEFNNLFTFLSEINEDRSHITLKLRQVLNNIRFNILNENWKKGKEDEYGKYNQYHTVKLKKLINRIQNINKENIFLYEELVPIGCFNTILWVKNNEDDESVSNMDVLSSGEQHFIHSIQSILYHLINVNSVFETTANKIKYSFVNIVLDEIELYYHPEFQRIFINELLLKIKSLSIPNIKGINILFCTHSPFILSDIPKENTLRLDDGKIELNDNSENSLGANIHDLLSNDFYLKNGFMGEYTKEKIFSLINFLDKNKTIKEETFNYNWDKKNSKCFIELIGEPLLKGSLKELYYTKFKTEIDVEIERLTNLKNQLNR